MYIRVALIILAITMLTIVSLSSTFLLSEHVACIEDKMFNMTERLNTYFAENLEMRDAFMIICGLAMDIMVLT